jgi:hypothetical protein
MQHGPMCIYVYGGGGGGLNACSGAHK